MIWYKHLLWAIVTLLFLIEGSLIPWVMPSLVSEMGLFVVPQFALILILYIGIYLNRHMAIAMGLVFGMLHDIIYYGHMLGVYAFGMGLSVYLITLILRDSHVSWYTGIGCIGMGFIFFDTLEYGLYRLFQVTEAAPWWYFVHAVFPSLVLNLTFALLVYYPIMKGFTKIEKFVASDDSEVFTTGNS